MLSVIKAISKNRIAWLLLIISCSVLEVIALYFQYGMGLAPCVMCIYERVALLVILLSGVIGFFFPHIALLRGTALLIGAYGAYRGMLLAIKHTDYQLHPAPWNQCSPFVDFPKMFPLDDWLPAFFAPSGDCSKISWQLWGLSMPQWLIIIFSMYLLVFILLICSQFKGNNISRHILH